MTFQLRPYQIEARDAILKEWYEKEIDATLAILFTGAGKTECALGAMQEIFNRIPDARILMFAHREELVYQPIDRIKLHWPELEKLNPGVVMANYDQVDRKIIVATIQTLNAKGRLDRIFQHGKITHLISDECHHILSRTSLELVSKLKEHNPDLKILGITATPKRTDGDKLSRVFKTIAKRLTILDGIRLQVLSPFIAQGFQLPVSIGDISVSSNSDDGSDWNAEELGNILKATNVEDIVFEKWHELAKERSTIAFCASVAQANSLAQYFINRGIKAKDINGMTPKSERKQMLDDFRSGNLQLITSCDVLNEGTDLPIASCGLMVRPTRSDLRYTQAVGRLLRLYPGKQNSLILDFAPMNARDMIMAGDILGKPREQKKAEAKAVKAGIILDCFGVKSDGTEVQAGIDGDADQVIMTVLDFFQESALPWTIADRLATVSVGDSKSLAVVLPDQKKLNDLAALKARIDKANALKMDGKWADSWDKTFNQLTREYNSLQVNLDTISSYRIYVIVDRKVEFLGKEKDWQAASWLATSWNSEHGDPMLNTRKKKWRLSAASDKQIELCKKIGCYKDGMNKGQAAQAITQSFSKFALQKARVL